MLVYSMKRINSMRIGANIMQKRPLSDFFVTPYEFSFDRDFPVLPPWGLHTVSDENVSTLHFHNGLELGYCYKGAGVFFVNNKIMPFFAGDVSIIFKNEAHIAQSHKNNLSEWKFATIEVEGLLSKASVMHLASITKILYGSNSFCNIISNNDHPEIIQLVCQIISETENKLEGHKTVVTGLVLALMGKLIRLIKIEEIGEQHTHKSNHNLDIISPALNYLSKNYYEQITVEELANLCNISITHFRRIFNSVMEIAPMEYLFHIRIKMAVILLNNPHYSILDIAMQVGYSSITSFNKHFKRIIGETPTVWRKNQRNR